MSPAILFTNKSRYALTLPPCRVGAADCWETEHFARHRVGWNYELGGGGDVRKGVDRGDVCASPPEGGEPRW